MPMIQQTRKALPPLVEIRCRFCGRMLGRLPINTPYQIKCPKCHEMNEREKAE